MNQVNVAIYDGIGFLIPKYKQGEQGEPEAADPVLAAPLREQNLLHYFVSDEVIDEAAATKLANAVGNLIEGGSLELLMKEDMAFQSLSMSRLGFSGSRVLAEKLFERLKSTELAKESEDGLSIPMHPTVRYLTLV